MINPLATAAGPLPGTTAPFTAPPARELGGGAFALFAEAHPGVVLSTQQSCQQKVL